MKFSARFRVVDINDLGDVDFSKCCFRVIANEEDEKFMVVHISGIMVLCLAFGVEDVLMSV
eukprot:11183155-Lingulodinium_polyedra.AAC.1